MKIAIYGLGYVGCVSLGCLAQKGHKVIGVDINKSKVKQVNNGKATIVENDIDNIINTQVHKGNIQATSNVNLAVKSSTISIICVGTPNMLDGSLDLSAVYNVVKNIAKELDANNKFHIIVIRSTTRVGTCSEITKIISKYSNKIAEVDFTVVCNPEFLREGTAVYDFENPPYTLIGSCNTKAIRILKNLYNNINSEVIVTDIEIAELLKYINNTYHALKVGFANEIGNVCKELEIDSHKLMDIFCKDTQLNISPYYFKPGYAYGGSCLPKDLKALQKLSDEKKLFTPIIHSIEQSNNNQIERAQKIIEKFNIKNIAILGISFKKGTDDLRNSPIISLLQYFYKNKYSIKIYDYNISYALLTGTNKDYININFPYLSKLLCSDLNEVINNSELAIISHAEPEYSKILEKYNGIIIDLARLNKKIRSKNNYFGINW